MGALHGDANDTAIGARLARTASTSAGMTLERRAIPLSACSAPLPLPLPLPPLTAAAAAAAAGSKISGGNGAWSGDPIRPVTLARPHKASMVRSMSVVSARRTRSVSPAVHGRRHWRKNARCAPRRSRSPPPPPPPLRKPLPNPVPRPAPVVNNRVSLASRRISLRSEAPGTMATPASPSPPKSTALTPAPPPLPSPSFSVGDRTDAASSASSSPRIPTAESGRKRLRAPALDRQQNIWARNNKQKVRADPTSPSTGNFSGHAVCARRVRLPEVCARIGPSLRAE